MMDAHGWMRTLWFLLPRNHSAPLAGCVTSRRVYALSLTTDQGSFPSADMAAPGLCFTLLSPHAVPDGHFTSDIGLTPNAQSSWPLAGHCSDQGRISGCRHVPHGGWPLSMETPGLAGQLDLTYIVIWLAGHPASQMPIQVRAWPV